jgi:D-3-phosphoglycerate dehydrogenase / 2-oxoglutarate reductase
MKVLITTVPFASQNTLPLEMLRESGAEFVFNPIGRKLTDTELAELVPDVDILIAGTELINEKVLQKANKLKLISRVGIGLDSVNLNMAKNLGIQVCYTPDAPAPAVAELTIGVMLSLLRSIHISNAELHNKTWNRHFGRRIPDVSIGIIGVGRIGSRVIRRLTPFGSPRVLINDLQRSNQITDKLKLEWVDKETIFRECDVISLHVPLTSETKNLVGEAELRKMKKDALLINMARGGIVDEVALYQALVENRIGGAAIDVFENEPYTGPLTELPNCILTAHMGSMSTDCRVKMEIDATEDAVRYIRQQSLLRPVPASEYLIQTSI